VPVGSSQNPPEPASGHSGVGRRGFLTVASGAVAVGTSAALGAPASAASTRTAPATATTATAPPPAQHSAGQPDFGPNVYVFDSATSTATIQSIVDKVYAQQAGADSKYKISQINGIAGTQSAR